MVSKANFLRGMKEISEFVGFGQATVVKHKKNYPGMPIRLEGACWIGDPVKLEAFYQDLAAGETEKWL
ncbi:MAG: hypothetical protein V1797_05360 [Pseudomonadota bacterium]